TLMAAGFVQIDVKDSKGTVRSVSFWSDDGTTAGNLYSVSVTGKSDLSGLADVTAGPGTSAAAQRMTLASDDPAVVLLGAKADAKSAATDTTAISAMSVWKQISA